MDDRNNSRSIIGKRRPKNNQSGQNIVPQQKVSDNETTQPYEKRGAKNSQNYSQSRTTSQSKISKSPQKIREEEFLRRRKNANRKKSIGSQDNYSNSQRTKNVNNQPNFVTNQELSENGTVALKPKKSLKSRLLRILLILVALFLLAIFSVYAYAKFTPLNPDLSGILNIYDISSNAASVASTHRIANVAIFGVDGREDVEGDRSDAIMIGSADFEHNKLKVTSLMRDTYVEMAGEDYFDKLNAAYAIGGPQEAIKTINLNFDTAITDYIVFDFTALVAMVNSVGGVEINVENEDELYWINQYLMDVNDKVKTADPDVPGTGPQTLTGSQALAYARIRYTGNGDYDRTQRQRNILQQVVARASAMSIPQQINLIQTVLPYIETSLQTSEIVKYALNVLFMKDRTIEQFRLPADGLVGDGYLKGVSYIFPKTLEDNIKAWYQFVYEIDYTPSPTAQEISEEIQYTWD